MDPVLQRASSALGVVLLDSRIRALLTELNPQALAQAESLYKAIADAQTIAAFRQELGS